MLEHCATGVESDSNETLHEDRVKTRGPLAVGGRNSNYNCCDSKLEVYSWCFNSDACSMIVLLSVHE